MSERNNNHNRKRNNQIKFYLSDKELKILDEKIKNYDGNRSDFIRDCIKKNELDLNDYNKRITQLIREYKAIGNNINQIARLGNQGLLSFEKIEIELFRKEMSRLWQLLRSLREENV